jgi:hypothetical protein
MVISHGVVGSAYLSKTFDSEPVNPTKLLIGVIPDAGKVGRARARRSARSVPLHRSSQFAVGYFFWPDVVKRRPG